MISIYKLPLICLFKSRAYIVEYHLIFFIAPLDLLTGKDYKLLLKKILIAIRYSLYRLLKIVKRVLYLFK